MGEAAIRIEPARLVVGGHAADLAFFWREWESIVGIRSTFYAMLACAEGLSPGGSGRVDHESMPGVVDRGECRRARRVYRALRWMDDHGQGKSILVLHVLYGEQRPMNPLITANVGDLAPLATMTAAAEEARESMACQRGTERESSTRLRCVQAETEAASDFWRIAPRWEAIERELAGKPSPSPERARSLREERSRLRAILDAAIHTDTVEPLPAVLSALSGADRETTHEEAVVTALRAVKWQREAFAARLRLEARELQSSALRVYGQARKIADP